MRLRIAAVGRLRAGPERVMLDNYLTRFERTGRRVGLGRIDVIEVDAKGPSNPAAEAPLILRAIPDGAVLVALDELGSQASSPDFAAMLARWRDQGLADVAFAIGGADGLDDSVRNRADVLLSLGQMVWPHMLVRVMLAEQLYRAASILAGTPYHRA